MTRVVVVGASGNVGSRVIPHLRDAGVGEIVGVARRPPKVPTEATWVRVDIGGSLAATQLREVFRGADAVIHLAWQIQPGRDIERLERTNVEGSRNVVAAVLAAGVPALIYASSVGAYSPGPKDRRVDESWPTDGIPSSTYARHKAAVERIIDEAEAEHPTLRVVRFRPGLIFQRDAGSEIARYFLGPYLPLSLLHERTIPIVPTFSRLAFQAVHADDVGRAFALAAISDSVSGAFNLAAEPVFDGASLSRVLGARRVPVPFSALRLGADLAFRARLTPTDAGWVDMAAAVPLMSTERARSELGWTPENSAEDALRELLAGMRNGSGLPTPPLRADASVTARVGQAVRTVVHGGPGAEDP
ncbi:MAG: NAD-dependent epimerase/dehydratase family protein [Mycobacteriales bacterium]